jgi:hypothetical protein
MFSSLFYGNQSQDSKGPTVTRDLLAFPALLVIRAKRGTLDQVDQPEPRVGQDLQAQLVYQGVLELPVAKEQQDCKEPQVLLDQLDLQVIPELQVQLEPPALKDRQDKLDLKAWLV